MTDPAPKKPAIPYVIVACTTLLCIVITQLYPWLQSRGSGALLLAGIVLGAWTGGRRAGGVALIVALGLRLWFDPIAATETATFLESSVRYGLFAALGLLIVTVLDSRANALAAAELSRGRLIAALGAARMGAWDKNLRTGVFWWSDGMEELFGRRPGAFIPTYEDFLGYIHPDDRGFVTNAFTSSVERGTDFEIEHRICRPDHDVRWMITRGRIFFDSQGRPSRLLGVAVDTTDRHAADSVTGDSAHQPLTAMPGRL